MPAIDQDSGLAKSETPRDTSITPRVEEHRPRLSIAGEAAPILAAFNPAFDHDLALELDDRGP
jgi:hypothetical protein